MTDPVIARQQPSAGFDLEPERLEALLAEGLHGVDDGELFLEYRETESFSLDDGRLKGAAFDTTKGFGLRAVAGEAIGCAHSPELSEAALRRAIDAIGAVRAGHSGVLALPARGTNRRRYGEANPIRGHQQAAKVALLEQIDAYARAKDPRVRQVSASLSGSWQADRDRARRRRARGRHPPPGAAQRQCRGRRRRPHGNRQPRRRRPLLCYDGLLEPAKWQAHGRRGPAPGAGQARVGRRAGRRDARRARPRLARHPAARGDRPRAGGRLQPQEDLGLLPACWASGSPRPASPWSTTARSTSGAARSPSTTRARPATCTVLIEDGILVGYMQDRLNARLMGA